MIVTDKYINPFTDFGFKKLFGTEPNKDLIYKKNDHLGATEFDRKTIFDLYFMRITG